MRARSGRSSRVKDRTSWPSTFGTNASRSPGWIPRCRPRSFPPGRRSPTALGQGGGHPRVRPTAIQETARHFPTVCCATPSLAATSLFGRPSAQPSTILDRNANACDDFRRRAHRSSWSRSSEDNSSRAFGRPVRGIPQFYYLLRVSTARHTRCDGCLCPRLTWML